jgi:hypothetical protein
MGCDIHIYVEIRKENKWELFELEHFTLSEWEKRTYKMEKGASPFDWRSYSMYGFLAGVRRSGVTPIKECKYELPKDVSNEVKNAYIQWEDDAHSASFLTLKELLEFDYNKDFTTLTNKRNVLVEKIFIEKEYSENDIEHYYNNKEDETYYDALGGPDSMFFVHLKELSELGHPDDVRIVFWFDN